MLCQYLYVQVQGWGNKTVIGKFQGKRGKKEYWNHCLSHWSFRKSDLWCL